jgi:hypothetical protein
MTFYYIGAKSFVAKKNMSADGEHASGRTRIVTDSARKRKRKEVLAIYKKNPKN